MISEKKLQSYKNLREISSILSSSISKCKNLVKLDFCLNVWIHTNMYPLEQLCERAIIWFSALKARELNQNYAY